MSSADSKHIFMFEPVGEVLYPCNSHQRCDTDENMSMEGSSWSKMVSEGRRRLGWSMVNILQLHEQIGCLPTNACAYFKNYHFQLVRGGQLPNAILKSSPASQTTHASSSRAWPDSFPPRHQQPPMQRSCCRHHPFHRLQSHQRDPSFFLEAH